MSDTFNIPGVNSIQEHPQPVDVPQQPIGSATRDSTSQDPSAASPTGGEESRPATDPNKIVVHVNDPKAPIILLFGAASSGKTMTLVRLAKYLKLHNYRVYADPNFCSNAWEYTQNVDRFNDMLNTQEALPGTNRNDFLFVKICDEYGKVICQILEGAGEDYFPMSAGSKSESMSFPPYMNGIFASGNRKIWMFLTEPNWAVDYDCKVNYVNRIKYCKSQHLGHHDKCIILYNKVDKTPYVVGAGRVHTNNAIKGCSDEYPGLMNAFKNRSVLPWANPYTFKFVPFCTGIYTEGDTVHYTASHDNYPKMLWDAILSCIKGK